MKQTFQIELPLRTIFEAPTLSAFARRVELALRQGETLSVPPLVAGARPEALPLSFAQQRLWVLDQLEPESTTYLEPHVLSIAGALDALVLERSLQTMISRHESLRTTFAEREGEPVQIIQPVGPFALPIIDLQAVRREQREEEAQRLATQEAQRPCDLVRGPLVRTYLLRKEPEEHALLWTLHHIITDGWSYMIFIQELTSLYRAFVAGESSPLAPLSIQYADYALWQRQWLQGEMLQKHLAYWQQQLQGASPLELPADAPRIAAQSHDGARYSFELTTDLSAELVSFSRREGVTLFMTLLAAFQVLLYRISGQTDVVVGTDVANRTQVEMEGLIGFFLNLLALRTKMQGAPSFRKVLRQVRGMVLDAYMHQEAPFEMVVEQVRNVREDGQTPLLHVLCVMQNTPRQQVELPGVVLETIEQEQVAARFDLALFLREDGEEIKGSVVYRAGLFKEQTIAAWMRHFVMLLQSITADPDELIDVLEMYTEEEKAKSLKEKADKSQARAKRIRTTKSKGVEIR